MTRGNNGGYGTSWTWRGNPTHITRLGATQQSVIQYDILGIAEKMTQGSTTVQMTPDAATLSVPQAITPNSDPTKQTTMQYNSWLGMTQQVFNRMRPRNP